VYIKTVSTIILLSLLLLISCGGDSSEEFLEFGKKFVEEGEGGKKTEPEKILEPLSDNDIVYITEYGTHYHRGDCKYLEKSRMAIVKGDAKKKGYKPCEICKP